MLRHYRERLNEKRVPLRKRIDRGAGGNVKRHAPDF